MIIVQIYTHVHAYIHTHNCTCIHVASSGTPTGARVRFC